MAKAELRSEFPKNTSEWHFFLRGGYNDGATLVDDETEEKTTFAARKITLWKITDFTSAPLGNAQKVENKTEERTARNEPWSLRGSTKSEYRPFNKTPTGQDGKDKY